MWRIFALLAAFAPVAAAQDAWVLIPSGTVQDLRAVHFGTPEVGFAAGAAGTVLRSMDGGLSWVDASPDAAPDLHDVHFFDIESGVAVGDGGAIYRTLNAGVDWTLVPSGVDVPLQSVSFVGDVGVAGGGAQTILRSDNRGATWTVVQTDFFGGGFPGAHMLDATHAYVAGTNSIFQPLVGMSDDAGVTFDFAAFYLDPNEGNLRDVHFLTPAIGLVAGVTWDGQGAIARTVNGGADWTTTLFASALEAIDFATPSVGYAVGHIAGMLRSPDGGQSWAPTPPLGSAILHDIDFSSATNGVAVGSSGTIYRGTLTTSDAPAPARAAAILEAPRPNPSAGRATVAFHLPAPAPATLRLVDPLGRAVALIADGPRAAGRHEVALDAARLPAGVYRLVLTYGATRTGVNWVVAGR